MIDAVISRRDLQTDDIVVLDLVAADGSNLPPFEPGAHIDVEIEPGLMRQYSLCGNPTESGSYRLGILKDPKSRGGSAAIHEGFVEGKTVRLGLPRNLFPLDPEAPLSILVGGGIGITPMIAMAYALHAEGRAFEVHYCVRARDRAAFMEELSSAPFAHQVHLHFDEDGGPSSFDPSKDLPDPVQGGHVYVCGPTGFMTWLREAALKRGYPAERLHQEFFAAEVDTAGQSFEVVLAQSGRTVTVPEGKSIVAALAEIGVNVDVSCEQGVCGTCLCDVLEGVPDHRGSFLTDEERAANDQILLCCSRAKSKRLVLDL